eukprot:CAMPEP_0181404558 /NCGR_PEP_ID=MMETSP1110-20121109/4309_1 /TAXON_ID=174948 /ORGANISM="Symbiodinium sp., Strain CCMP421" /LENGTH=214 /DNA_ID=CAMNT_0023526925 /DNA_START=677 /DNA_END=1317 /DNA_ORIENTATION=+
MKALQIASATEGLPSNSGGEEESKAAGKRLDNEAHVVVAQTHPQGLEGFLGLSRCQVRRKATAIPEPQHAHVVDKRPDEPLQRENADEEAAGNQHMEQMHGSPHLEGDVLHRGDRAALTQGLQQEAERVCATFRKNGDRHIEEEAYQAQRREGLENEDALPVTACESNLGRDEDMQQTDHPIHRHHQNAHHRHHHAGRGAASLVDVVDGIRRQG